MEDISFFNGNEIETSDSWKSWKRAQYNLSPTATYASCDGNLVKFKITESLNYELLVTDDKDFESWKSQRFESDRIVFCQNMTSATDTFALEFRKVVVISENYIHHHLLELVYYQDNTLCYVLQAKFEKLRRSEKQQEKHKRIIIPLPFMYTKTSLPTEIQAELM